MLNRSKYILSSFHILIIAIFLFSLSGCGYKAPLYYVEEAPEGGFWAICPEIPGANGQGESIEEAKESLREAIELILEDRREDIFRGLPDDVIRDKVMVA